MLNEEVVIINYYQAGSSCERNSITCLKYVILGQIKYPKYVLV